MFNKEFFGKNITHTVSVSDLNLNKEDFQEEAKELERFVKIKKNDNWAKFRTPEGNFKLQEIEYPFGIRKSYVPLTSQKNKDLQSSRGIGIDDNMDLDDLFEKIATEMTLKESDEVRIEELEIVFNEIKKIDPKNGDHYKLVENFLNRETLGVCEVGFRSPRLIKYYQNKMGFKNAMGFDINKFNVAIGKKLGYDSRYHDLNSKKKINLKNYSLVLSYHSLEHCSNPLTVLKKIFNGMEPGTLFHVEVPIEPDGPRIRFGHLFAFHENDLVRMLSLAGFDILTIGRKTHTGGPLIERCTAVKK